MLPAKILSWPHFSWATLYIISKLHKIFAGYIATTEAQTDISEVISRQCQTRERYVRLTCEKYVLDTSS